jgi:heptosyltransferase-1
VGINSVLIVRLAALGDIIHALPVAAALREACPDARIDWLAKAKHRAVLDLVPVIDHLVLVGPAARRNASPAAADTFLGAAGLARAIRTLRSARYDVALDLQGLGKSAALARLSGARRVIGFPSRHLRERWARLFYTEVSDPSRAVHVIEKNLSVVDAIGIRPAGWSFPLALPASIIVEQARQLLPAGAPGFALVNPGGGWPNKRWSPDRFGAVAAAIRARRGLPSLVLWGPGEEEQARAVVRASEGAAALAPPTTIGDLFRLVEAARLVVSGDTGPLHMAAALGTPIVGIYGPTNPARNGPWNPADVSLSRFETCVCHHKRRCRRASPCLLDISVDEVVSAADRRLAAASP